MEEIEKDLDNTFKLIIGKNNYREYDYIYLTSNEFLKQLNINLQGKDVLTVIGSSDQIFYAYNNKAKTVDCFDKNKLAIYFYYLRKWLILYEEKYYFSINILDDIKELLNEVKCDKEEEIAFNYWKKFISKNISDKELVFRSDINKKRNCIKDLKLVKEKLIECKTNPLFLDINEKINIEKKYDVIILSNILEYSNYGQKLKNIYDNMKRILKEQGIVVCSHIMENEFSESFISEKDFFKQDFNYIEFPYINYGGVKEPVGYAYIKK